MKDFESCDDDDEEDELGHHHEQKESYQARYAGHTVALKDAFLEFQSPYTVQGSELIAIDTRVVADAEGTASLYGAAERGYLLYSSFVKERLVDKTRSLYDPIPKCQIKIFVAKKAPASSTNTALRTLKSDVETFARLFIVSTCRDLDLDEFFTYENQFFPPSISLNGFMRPGNKPLLLRDLEKLDPEKSLPLCCDGLVIDGAFFVHCVQPKEGVKCFESYVKHLISKMEYLITDLGFKRVDIAWDQYSTLSLKNATRISRGSGVRRKDLPKKGRV